MSLIDYLCSVEYHVNWMHPVSENTSITLHQTERGFPHINCIMQMTSNEIMLNILGPGHTFSVFSCFDLCFDFPQKNSNSLIRSPHIPPCCVWGSEVKQLSGDVSLITSRPRPSVTDTTYNTTTLSPGNKSKQNLLRILWVNCVVPGQGRDRTPTTWF